MQHAVPRQITTFEFKLIGIMSVKQFVYLMIFTGITVGIYFAVTKPSKFVYVKDNPIPDFLRDVYIVQDDSVTQNHLDASQKLSKYMNATGQTIKDSPNKQHITRLIIETQAFD